MAKTARSPTLEDSPKCNNNNDTEVAWLRKKLRLKSEALNVLSEELDRCRVQRDRFKLMAEQMQTSPLLVTKRSNGAANVEQISSSVSDEIGMTELLSEARERNKCLRLQVETLRQKFGDARADVEVLRASRERSNPEPGIRVAPDIHQREEMIEQLEKMNIKCTQLQTDFQAVIDEKHELEMERDAFKCKAHRLNYELSKALNATTTVDLDSLINENRFLHERLQQLLEEKELANQSLSKYKGMLDSKRTKGTIKLGGNSAAGTVMTYKQVEQLLQQATQIPPQKSAAAISDLRRLCAALLEALNDKTLALVHQKKANKILAARICELNNTIESPTMKLLDGYAGADVDSTLDGDINDPKCDIISTMSDSIRKREDDFEASGRSSDCAPPNVHFDRSLRGLSMELPELPKNLGELVEKALLNLRGNDKDK